MAVIGITIGLSFSLAMVISPAITHYFGLAGIFYFTALLAILGLVLLHVVIPTPQKEPFHLDSEVTPKLFKQVIKNHHLQRLNLGIFCQHFVLTATFFAMPILLQQQMKLGHLAQQWHFYLPLMLCSFIAMLPFLVLAEKKQQIKTVFLASVAITCLCQFALAFTNQHWLAICSFMFVYFVGFNILEASLPSLVSRQASAESKGTAMGIYSSSQFLGIFAGGAFAGVIYQYYGNQGIFIINSFISLLWLSTTFYLKPNVYQLTLILSYDNTLYDASELSNHLKLLPGVTHVALAPEENVVYLRIDKLHYQEGSAHHVMKQLSDNQELF